MEYKIGFAYDKARAWPDPIGVRKTAHRIYRGFEARGGLWPLLGIVLHSTEGQRNSSFDSECRFVRDSPDVSAHYYIGRAGQIERILDPGRYVAYHAGVSRWRGRPAANLWAVGIELHHSRGGPDYTYQQLDALSWLCRLLTHDHPTITKPMIALHRWIALPPGRKYDPSDRTDEHFQKWIFAL